MEKHHVQIAGVVHLAAAKLSQRQDDRPGRLGVGTQPGPVHGPPEPLDEPRLIAGHDPLDERLGNRGQGGGCGLGVLPAEHVPHSDPQLLRHPEGVEDRGQVYRALAELGQIGLERGRRRQPFDQQAVEELVDHARIHHEQPRQKGARRTQPHRQVERRRVEAEQFPEHPLATQRVGHVAERGQRGVRIGRAADRRQQPRRDRRQEVAAAPGGQKPHPLLGE